MPAYLLEFEDMGMATIRTTVLLAMTMRSGNDGADKRGQGTITQTGHNILLVCGPKEWNSERQQVEHKQTCADGERRGAERGQIHTDQTK